MNARPKPTVATLFLDMENVHLIKDPGMIPLTLQQRYGWRAVIPLWDDREYPYKATYFSEVCTPLLRGHPSPRRRHLTLFSWLRKNAPRIDVLHLFFFERWTWLYIWLYKRRNPAGAVYVHCDTDGQRLLDYQLPASGWKRRIIRTLLSDQNIRDVLWGVQNRQNSEKLQKKWPFENIRYIPNGVSWRQEREVPYEQRSDTILTVARNGDPSKKTDLLLEGFAAVAAEFPRWKLRLVGTVEPDFEPYIQEYFQRHPELRERVWFSGPVTDRDELQQIYSDAKVFCLPSAWESFGLATVEALSCGCYAIGSDIPANVNMLRDGTYGTLFASGSLEDLTEKLRQCLRDEPHMKATAQAAYRYVAAHYTWEKALEPVVAWVNRKKEKQP